LVPIDVSPFGTDLKPPDAAELSEEVIVSMIERARVLGVVAGHVAALIALDHVASLATCWRAPLPTILVAIA
jgi:hypothetical protein